MPAPECARRTIDAKRGRQTLERLRLKAVEVATHPRTGVQVDSLAEVLRRHPVKACWFMPSFQNPLGALMPENAKRAMVELLARHEAPLIEDDVYAELPWHLSEQRLKRLILLRLDYGAQPVLLRVES